MTGDAEGGPEVVDAAEAEPEDNSISYSDYLAQQAEKKLSLGTLEIRKPNEGKQDKKWANAKPLSKEEEEDFVAATNIKAKRERERTAKKTTVEFDQRFVEPTETRGGRGGGFRGGRGRGDGQARGRGEGQRGGRGEGRGDRYVFIPPSLSWMPVAPLWQDSQSLLKYMLILITDVLVEMALSEALAEAKADPATTLLPLSTPRTRTLSQAWEHKPLLQRNPDFEDLFPSLKPLNLKKENYV